jgi:hypothetical protein
MAWIKVDDQMIDHPKIEPLSKDAFWWIHKGLSYANRFLTDGVLPKIFVAKVPAAVLKELTTIRAGQRNPVWHRGKSGNVRIHDFKDYQPSKTEVERDRRRNRARQAKWRSEHKKGKTRNTDSNAVSNGVTNSAPARPGPAGTVPPVVPQGGRHRTRRSRHLPSADPSAIQQALDTRRRRQEMAAAGMSADEIEVVLEREHLERKKAS